ncbi:MAG: hypothetical protein BRD57_00935, partial [Proteobacteria bacterium SW_6_67_9]
RVAVLPELALVGYPPDDLLLRPDFAERVEQALDRLSQALADTGVATIVGAPLEEGGARYNGAVVLDGGARIAIARKRCLPNYGVFDEKRYFVAAHEATVAEIDGRRLGLIVCEDIWEAEPARAVRAAGAEAIVCINASPFDWRKRSARARVAQERASACGVPFRRQRQRTRGTASLGAGDRRGVVAGQWRYPRGERRAARGAGERRGGGLPRGRVVDSRLYRSKRLRSGVGGIVGRYRLRPHTDPRSRRPRAGAGYGGDHAVALYRAHERR